MILVFAFLAVVSQAFFPQALAKKPPDENP
jgi:hypothetical protein